MHHLLTKAASAAIPKMVDSGIDWLKSVFVPDTDKVEPKSTISPFKIPHKTSAAPIVAPVLRTKTGRVKCTRKITRDRSPFSRQQYDYVIEMVDFWSKRNRDRPAGITMYPKSDLVIELNKTLRKNKSQTFYSKIWNGRVDRESFPDEDDLPENK